MLIVARKKIKYQDNLLANGQMMKRRLAVFEKYYMQHTEEIKQLKADLHQQKKKQQQDAQFKVDTIIPKEEHIKQWELNKALAENQRLRDEFEEKDKIIA